MIDNAIGTRAFSASLDSAISARCSSLFVDGFIPRKDRAVSHRAQRFSKSSSTASKVGGALVIASRCSRRAVTMTWINVWPNYPIGLLMVFVGDHACAFYARACIAMERGLDPSPSAAFFP